MQKFSVLMSVYYKEQTDYLCQSLDSIFTQTLRADEVVLVEDGPLTKELDKTIEKYQKEYPELKLVKLKENQGLGKALNEGLKHCSFDIVARMDTDDIAKPHRFEKQINFLEQHSEIDIVSSWIDEFVTSIKDIRSVRKIPEKHNEIYEFGKKRNPLNHVSAVFRKHSVIEAGNYQHFPLFEDYYLWVRMLLNGSRFYNIQESLLFVRTNEDMFKRRGGWKYAKDEIRFQTKLLQLGYINILQYLRNIFIRFFTRIIPNNLRGWIYKMIRK